MNKLESNDPEINKIIAKMPGSSFVPNTPEDYLSMGWSIIPVGKDKKPLIDWKKYQTEKPTEKDITEWKKLNPLIAYAGGKPRRCAWKHLHG